MELSMRRVTIFGDSPTEGSWLLPLTCRPADDIVIASVVAGHGWVGVCQWGHTNQNRTGSVSIPLMCPGFGGARLVDWHAAIIQKGCHAKERTLECPAPILAVPRT